jgi:hypothetical protein
MGHVLYTEVYRRVRNSYNISNKLEERDCLEEFSVYFILTLQILVIALCTASFNIQQFYVLPTQCIYVFCTDLRTNSDYFPIQH